MGGSAGKKRDGDEDEAEIQVTGQLTTKVRV